MNPQTAKSIFHPRSTPPQVFGALISAVDPVSVLELFQELNVNRALHAIIFGESILNDGVCIALYRTMVAIAYEVSNNNR